MRNAVDTGDRWVFGHINLLNYGEMVDMTMIARYIKHQIPAHTEVTHSGSGQGANHWEDEFIDWLGGWELPRAALKGLPCWYGL